MPCWVYDGKKLPMCVSGRRTIDISTAWSMQFNPWLGLSEATLDDLTEFPLLWRKLMIGNRRMEGTQTTWRKNIALLWFVPQLIFQ